MNDQKVDLTKCILCLAPALRDVPLCKAHQWSPFYHHLTAILNHAAWRDDDMRVLDDNIDATQRYLDELKDRRNKLSGQPDRTEYDLLAVVYMARELHKAYPKLAYYGNINPLAPIKVVAPLTSQG